MDSQKLLRTGVAGSVITAVCCFTPILVIVLGAAGLAAWTGWLDYVLLPALAVFVGITVYALHRRRQEAACCPVDVEQNPERGA